MKTFTLNLDLNYEKLNLGDGHRATLDCYLPEFRNFEGETRPAIVVCPGGGYGHLSPREAEPIALEYTAAGMAAFVLNYSIAPDAAFPRCLLEALCAIKTVRENAKDWSINPNQISIIGFSAGGHLAASASAYWNSNIAKNAFGDTALCKVDAAILAYPVITSHSEHQATIINLIGDNKELLDAVSIEKQVTADYPPTFIWHTATDSVVPVNNSIHMAQALDNANISFELHIYPEGPHGLSLADERTAKPSHPQYMVPRVVEWVDNSIRFLKEIAFKN